MAILILGGVAQSFRINVPEHKELRPTAVILRRKIFDAHQDLSDWTFIDLCAGTGAMGLEAWSRGAERIFLIEKNKVMLKNLEQTLKEFKSRYPESSVREIKLVSADTTLWIKQWKEQYRTWSSVQQMQTILFLDPPYKEVAIYDSILELLTRESWFKGELWVESDKLVYPIEAKIAAFDLKTSRAYDQGGRTISIVRFS